MLILQGLGFPIPPNLINKNWAVMASKPSGKECSLIKVKVLVTQSCLTLCKLWTVAYQAPLSLEFSRQEYWSGLPFPSPGAYIQNLKNDTNLLIEQKQNHRVRKLMVTKGQTGRGINWD